MINFKSHHSKASNLTVQQTLRDDENPQFEINRLVYFEFSKRESQQGSTIIL